jgi:hypothetical protein
MDKERELLMDIDRRSGLSPLLLRRTTRKKTPDPCFCCSALRMLLQFRRQKADEKGGKGGLSRLAEDWRKRGGGL